MLFKLEESNRARVEHVNARLDSSAATLGQLADHLLGASVAREKEEFIMVHGEKYVHINHVHKHGRHASSV